MSATLKSVSNVPARPRRRNHSEDLKRELVQRSLLPGASVSALAMAHGINANLLFGWRRAHLRTLEAPSVAEPPRATLVPVKVVHEDKPGRAEVAVAPPPRAANPAGTIEIELAGARVRLRGTVDEVGLRSVLAALRASDA